MGNRKGVRNVRISPLIGGTNAVAPPMQTVFYLTRIYIIYLFNVHVYVLIIPAGVSFLNHILFSYKLNANKASGIFRDRLASPLDTAVFWIEHVVKYGGDHLRLRSTEMGFIELNSLDVVAFLVVLSLIILYIDYIVVRGCYRCTCRKARKHKSD